MNEVSGSCDIILHIGAPKTGSSALQHFLFNNRVVLLKKGFYYPKHGFDINNISGGHSGIGAALINQDESKAQQIFDGYKLHAKKQGKTLLISAESLFNFPKQIKQLCDENDRVRVLSFFRDPIESIVSGYNQSVKRHYYTGTLGKFCQSTIDGDNRSASGGVLYDWVDTLKSGHLIVAGYNKPERADAALEKYFLSLLGIDSLEFDEFTYAAKPINRAYNTVVLEFKRCLNVILDKESRADNQSVDFLLQKISDEQSSQFEHLAPHLEASMQVALKKRFAETATNIQNELMLADSTVQSIISFSEEASIGMEELASVATEIDKQNAEVGAYIRMCLNDVTLKFTEQADADEVLLLTDIYREIA